MENKIKTSVVEHSYKVYICVEFLEEFDYIPENEDTISRFQFLVRLKFPEQNTTMYFLENAKKSAIGWHLSGTPKKYSILYKGKVYNDVDEVMDKIIEYYSNPMSMLILDDKL